MQNLYIKEAVNGKVSMFVKKGTNVISAFQLVQEVKIEGSKEVAFQLQDVQTGELYLVEASYFSSLRFIGYCENFAMKYRAYMQAEQVKEQMMAESLLQKSQIQEIKKPKIVT